MLPSCLPFQLQLSLIRHTDEVNRTIHIDFRTFERLTPGGYGWGRSLSHARYAATDVTPLLRTSDSAPKNLVSFETRSGVPTINFHYFHEGTDRTGEDLDGVIDAIRTIRQMNKRISNVASSEVVPGAAVESDEDLRTFVQNEAWGHHASCSNRMGSKSDRMAVVDSEFKVFGTRNLRVVDFSVFPRIPGYFPMVPILMFSEKASDVILAQARGVHHDDSAAN